MKYSTTAMSDEDSHADKMYFLTHNIENYFQNV